MRQGTEQPPRFILAIGLDGFAQIAIGDGLRRQQGAVQRRDDAAGQQPGQQDGHQRGHHGDDDNPENGAAVVGARFGRGGFGIAGIECHQLVELLTHLIGAVLDPRVDQRAHFIEPVLARQLQHLLLGLHVAVQGSGECLVQLRFFRLGWQRGITGLGAAQLVDQHADARLGILQSCRITVDQYPERQNAHAQHVFGHVAKKTDAGQLVRFHVQGGLADDTHAIHRKHPQHNDQQGNEGKPQESSRRDTQITQ